MLNFRNSGQGAGVGSMFTKKINPAYLWSFLGNSGGTFSGTTSQVVVLDSIASLPLNFTQGSGGSACNATLNAGTNTITINNTPGASGRIALTASFGINLTTFTFSFWAKVPNTSPSLQRLLELFSSTVNTFQIDVPTNSNFIAISTTAGGTQSPLDSLSGNPIVVSNLQHICITVNDTNFQVYINGVSVLTKSTFPVNGMSSFFIGNIDSGTYRGCTCTVADIRIYNFVLTQTQITALYNANQDVNAAIPTTNFINLY